MSKQISSIHDAFFKQVLSDSYLASTFLREHLPSSVASLLGPEPPELIAGSFVDEELRQHHSDLLYRVHLKAGQNALAYMLLEHKSSPDPAVGLQLLRYIVRILAKWHKENGKHLPLPPVVALVVHQGPGYWWCSREFANLFGPAPAELCPYLPSFRHVLLDLPLVEDAALSTDVRLRAHLKALKYNRRRDLLAVFEIVLAEAPLLQRDDLEPILIYLDKNPIVANSNIMDETLQRLVPERKEQIMGWIHQSHYDKGVAVGEAKGEAKGETSGKAKLFTRFLEKRFGEIPSSIRERIFAANLEAIDAWVERAFDAPDLRSIFDSN